jgi:hypothetical protein
MKPAADQDSSSWKDPTPFRTREAARRWIVNQGVTCSKDKFYKACERGQIRVAPDKTVSRSSVLEYLITLKDGAPRADLDLVDYSQQRQRLEVEKLQLEVDKLSIATRAADREWMRTEDHWAHLAAVLALCKGNLEHYTRMAASEIVLEAGGDYHAAPQVADRIVEAVINRSFNELAVQRIDAGRFEEIEEEQGESA